MTTPFDLGRFIKVIAMVGSGHDGEALTAARQADRLLRDAGMTWADLLKPHAELQISIAAAQQLLIENEELRARLDHGVADDFHPVGAPIYDARTTARWALALHARGAVWLNDFELGFLNSITRWRGALTAKQRPVLQQIVDRICERTGGEAPP